MKCKKIKEIISYHPISGLLSVTTMTIRIGSNDGNDGQKNKSDLLVKINCGITAQQFKLI